MEKTNHSPTFTKAGSVKEGLDLTAMFVVSTIMNLIIRNNVKELEALLRNGKDNIEEPQ